MNPWGRSSLRRWKISFRLIIAIWMTKAQAEENAGSTKPAVRETPGIGDYCELDCPSSNAVCKNSTCICHPGFPVHVRQSGACLKASLLGAECQDDLQCKYYDQNAICRRLSRDYVSCTCIENYVMRDIDGLQPPKVCFPGPAIIHKDIPTFLGFGLALSIMSALLCLVLKIFSRGRFARPRSYGNAAIPPPLTVSETYAAFALATASNGRSSPTGTRNSDRRGSTRSGSSSRRTSYTSLSQQKSDLKRLTSSNSFSYNRQTSRRLSGASARSFRSQSGFVLPAKSPDRDHYILYMVRGPTPSLTSNTTDSTTCGSLTPQASKSAEQILTVYRAVSEPIPLADLALPQAIGPSRTSSSFKVMSTDDVFQEEEEDEEEKESEENKKGETKKEQNKKGCKRELDFDAIHIQIEDNPKELLGKNMKPTRKINNELGAPVAKISGAKT